MDRTAFCWPCLEDFCISTMVNHADKSNKISMFQNKKTLGPYEVNFLLKMPPLKDNVKKPYVLHGKEANFFIFM